MVPPSMTGKDAGFVTLFTRHVGHPLLAFHCTVHQEALCAKSGLRELEVILKFVTKTVNFITARALNKRKFEQLLKEVQSVYSGLLMYNNVRWLSRGRVLERFVECLDEIRMFMDDNKQKCSELTDIEWLSRLMFFTDFSLHLNEVNAKLQGFGRTVDEAFQNLKAFETKLKIYKRDLDREEFHYFLKLKFFYAGLEIHEPIDKDAQMRLFSDTIDATLKQFSLRFEQFRNFEDSAKCIKYPDTIDFDNLDLSMFSWMELQDFEMELVELQSSAIWKHKFVDLRMRLEIIERERLNGLLEPHVSAENEIVKVWNELPGTYNSLIKVAMSILSIFSSTYSCESLFSTMNFIKSNTRNCLTDDLSAACVSLKNTKYIPDIKLLSSTKQQQKSH